MKFVTLLTWLLPVVLFSQAELRIGEWRNQIPYNNGIKITQSEEAIYYATDLAILQIQKSDLSTQKISRIEGLSGSKINAIYFHQKTKTLVVAYSDGLIDLITEDDVVAIPFIKIYNNIPITKNINSITIKDEKSVFINADFGLISLNLDNQLVEFTVFTNNIKIRNTIVYNNQYVCATSSGIYYFDINSGNLVEDFTKWNFYSGNEGLDPNENYIQVFAYGNNLYVLASEILYKYNQGVFDFFKTSPGFKYLQAYSEHRDLILTLKYTASDENILNILKNGTDWLDIKGDCVVKSTETLQEPNGRVWTADPRYGFRYIDDFNSECKFINISGPYNNNVFQVRSLADATYVASGGWNETYSPIFRSDGIYKYSKTEWKFINQSNNSLFLDNNVFDILRIEENKTKDKVYFASFLNGIVEYNKLTDSYILHNQKTTNGILGEAVGDPGNVRVSGLFYDNNSEKLWISNYLARNPIVSIDKAGKWESFAPPSQVSSQIINITVDHNGFKWLVLRDGLAVFDERDPNNLNDDRSIILNSSNSNISSNIIYNVTVDLEGDVWVGTAAGPVIFECGSSIFEGTCKGTRRKVDQNGIIGFLLETEEILSVAVDGANRKWIGTRNGMYVQSPSGEFQINYFNKDNSPLLSNSIFSISVNESTGEVWIGTDRGLQVYRSNAIFAKDQFVEDMKIFPNPATANYTGVIGIQGLARDARVKITDISGRLVYETFANGGQAIWNRKDYLGNDVASGVYLIFANTTKDFDVSEGSVGKLIIVR